MTLPAASWEDTGATTDGGLNDSTSSTYGGFQPLSRANRQRLWSMIPSYRYKESSGVIPAEDISEDG